MGYSHYFRRAPDLDRSAFVLLLEDIDVIFESLKRKGMLLAGPIGRGAPELSDITIAFNGLAECRHRYMDLGQPWPSRDAEGFERDVDPVVGPSASGALLCTRVCGGTCAGMPFLIDRTFIVRKWDQLEYGGYHCYCETQYKPYDLAVTSVLVRAKERLGDEIHVSSDGLERGFEEAKKICRELFGWSRRFELARADTEVV